MPPRNSRLLRDYEQPFSIHKALNEALSYLYPYHIGKQIGALGMVPLIINPIYTLYSRYVLGPNLLLKGSNRGAPNNEKGPWNPQGFFHHVLYDMSWGGPWLSSNFPSSFFSEESVRRNLEVFLGVQERYNTPLEHTPGNPPTQLWKDSLYNLLVKVWGCVPKVCWNNFRRWWLSHPSKNYESKWVHLPHFRREKWWTPKKIWMKPPPTWMFQEVSKKVRTSALQPTPIYTPCNKWVKKPRY